HTQSLAVAVMLTPPAPANADKDLLVEASVKTHETPAWFTVKVCPPIVSVPTRESEFGFAATAWLTVPFPVPLVADVIVKKLALLTAVHAQSLAVAVRLTLPVPPVADRDALGGVR